MPSSDLFIMEPASGTEVLVTAKNCRSLIGKRINVVLSEDVKKDVDPNDTKIHETVEASNIDHKKVEDKNTPSIDLCLSKGQTKDKSPEDNESSVKNENSLKEKIPNDNISNCNDVINDKTLLESGCNQNKTVNSLEKVNLSVDTEKSTNKVVNFQSEELNETLEPQVVKEISKDSKESISDSNNKIIPDQPKTGRKSSEKIDNKKKLKEKNSKKKEAMGKKKETSIPDTNAEQPLESEKQEVVMESISVDNKTDEVPVVAVVENSEQADDQGDTKKDANPQETSKQETNVLALQKTEIPADNLPAEGDIKTANEEATKEVSKEIKEESSPDSTSKDTDKVTMNDGGEANKKLDTKETTVEEKVEIENNPEASSSKPENIATTGKNPDDVEESPVAIEGTVPLAEQDCKKENDGNVTVDVNDVNTIGTNSSQDLAANKEKNGICVEADETLKDSCKDNIESSTNETCPLSEEQTLMNDENNTEDAKEPSDAIVENVADKLDEKSILSTSIQDATSTNVRFILFYVTNCSIQNFFL